jgi:hypothetical protein
MRFPGEKIKKAILHPDPEIRDRATSYFAESAAPEPAIMPLVIRAVETYGRPEAYRLIGRARALPQTDDTITWILGELNAPDTATHENYAYLLSMLLVEADPALLLPREAEITSARHFLPDLRAPFTERLRMLAWDEATCWLNLEAFCEENKAKQGRNEVAIPVAWGNPADHGPTGIACTGGPAGPRAFRVPGLEQGQMPRQRQ